MLNPYGFAPEEREAAITLFHALASLEHQVHQFKSALELADYVTSSESP